MKWLFRTIGSAVAALVITAGTAVITAIWLMFSGGSTEGRRLGFFESIFVEVQQSADASTQLGVGLNDPVPLGVTFVAITLFLLAVTAVYDQLRARKRALLAATD